MALGGFSQKVKDDHLFLVQLISCTCHIIVVFLYSKYTVAWNLLELYLDIIIFGPSKRWKKKRMSYRLFSVNEVISTIYLISFLPTWTISKTFSMWKR